MSINGNFEARKKKKKNVCHSHICTSQLPFISHQLPSFGRSAANEAQKLCFYMSTWKTKKLGQIRQWLSGRKPAAANTSAHVFFLLLPLEHPKLPPHGSNQFPIHEEIQILHI